MVGEDIRLQAREGRRAAVVPVRDGLWLVGDLDAEALEEFTAPKTGQSEIGFIPLLAPLMIAAATTALNPNAKGPGKNAVKAIGKLFGRRRRRSEEPASDVFDLELDDEDTYAEVGCAGRRCRCSR